MNLESLTVCPEWVEVTLKSAKVWVDGTIPCIPKATYELPLQFSTEQSVKDYLSKYPDVVLGYSLSHEPIIESQHVVAVQKGLLSWKDIVVKQRLLDQDLPYIDDFGFHVYAYAQLDFKGVVCKDMRYEQNNPIWLTQSTSAYRD